MFIVSNFSTITIFYLILIGDTCLKNFFIRLLQVIWVLSVLIAAIVIIGNIISSDMRDTLAVIFGFVIWFILLVVIQYLSFARVNPKNLFDGSLTKNY